MGLSPKRRWLLVTPKLFLASYSKYAWANLGVWLLMISTVFLFAPTVPSPPRPQNLQLTPSSALSKGRSGRDRRVTSSTMPMVKLLTGRPAFRFSKAAAIWAGVVSLEDRP